MLMEAVTDGITPILEEESEVTAKTDYAEELDRLIVEYRQAKTAMERLGFTDYGEYLDYLEFMQRNDARKSDMEM